MSAVATRGLEEKLTKHLLKDGVNGASVALMWEVSNGTGHARSGSADAISMSLWPSRGLHLTGYELKSSRGDWARELKRPDKAQKFYDYCHYWYLVVADEKIVQPGELPPTWGLIAPRGRGLGVIKESPFNDSASVPTPAFLASLLRAAIGRGAAAEQIAAIRAEEREAAERRSKDAVLRQQERANAYHTIIRDFEQASGLQMPHFNTWKPELQAESLGQAVRRVIDGDKDAERAISQIKIAHRVITEVCEKHGIEIEA